MEARLRYPVLLSILAAIVTFALKAASYWVTDSASLLSDAAEALVNLLAATTALVSLWYASRPIDPSHTYGHEKIEFFSSGLEGVLIFVAGGWIAYFAVVRLVWPTELEKLGLGAALALVAAFINFVVSQLLLRTARTHHSIVLEAEGQHLRVDVWTTLGVVLGLCLVWFGKAVWGIKLTWIDPAVALVLAANIAWTAIGLIRRSFDGLMDRALPDAEQVLVRAAIEHRLEPAMDYHALRTRRAGSRRFVDFHLLVPGDLSVRRAHALAGTIEEAVRAVLPGSEITVHIEPIEERGSWEDSALVPLERAAREAEMRRQREQPSK